MAAASKIRDEARAYARGVLGKCRDFPRLPANEQLALYKSLVDARSTELSLQQDVFAEAPDARPALARQLAPPPPFDRNGPASNKIDDQRHLNSRIDKAGELAGDFVRSVDFPKFVSELLHGVFEANLEVTIKQMQQYINLMKAATQSIAKFVNAIDDTAAFGYLAESHGDEFSLTFDDETKDEHGAPAPVLADKDGNKVDTADTAVKVRIMDAKIAMAREQRALLRETILMGVSRLVVERGTVKAAVLFDIKATEDISKRDRAADQTLTTMTPGAGLKLAGFGFGGGPRRTTRSTVISISSASSKATTNLEAKLAGSVEIVFKSDFFKLDNFAAMYGPVHDAPAAAGGGALPAGAPASPSPNPAAPVPGAK